MIIAIDIGATEGKVALYDRVLARLDTDRFTMTQGEEANFEEDWAALVRLIHEIKPPNDGSFSLGISARGRIGGAGDGLQLVESYQIPHWVGHPIEHMLVDEFVGGAWLLNNVEAAAFGELYHGVCLDEDFLYLHWGRGINAAVVRGMDDIPQVHAMEFGHQFVGMGGANCACGRSTCLEAHIGGQSLTDRYKVPVSELGDNIWSNSIMLTMARALQNLLCLHPVNHVVLGGDIGESQFGRLDDLKRWLRIWYPGNMPTFHRGTLGPDAALFGAAARVKHPHM